MLLCQMQNIYTRSKENILDQNRCNLLPFTDETFRQMLCNQSVQFLIILINSRQKTKELQERKRLLDQQKQEKLKKMKDIKVRIIVN